MTRSNVESINHDRRLGLASFLQIGGGSFSCPRVGANFARLSSRDGGKKKALFTGTVSGNWGAAGQQVAKCDKL